MHRAVEFIRPGRIGEQPGNRLRHLAIGFGPARPGHGAQTLGKFPATDRQVFPQIIENLRPVISGLAGPGSGTARRLYRISNILAIALGDRADHSAFR